MVLSSGCMGRYTRRNAKWSGKTVLAKNVKRTVFQFNTGEVVASLVRRLAFKKDMLLCSTLYSEEIQGKTEYNVLFINEV